ncbi:MAG: hypothetical protein ACR2OG_08535 [Gemmatimonadaceae bacterium]
MQTVPTSRHKAHRALATTVLLAFAVASALTCDSANVLGPTGARDLQLLWLSDTLLSIGSVERPMVRVERGGQPLIDPALLLTTADPDIISVTPRGDSLVAVGLGEVMVTVQVRSSLLPDGGVRWTRPLRVGLQDLVLDRASVLMGSAGDTATLRARALGAGGVEYVVPISWRSGDTTCVVVSEGRLLSRRACTTEVIAYAGNDTARANVRVEQLLARFSLSPQTVTLLAINDTARVTAVPLDAVDRPINGIVPFWDSENRSVAEVDASGLVTARGAGTTYVSASKGPVRNVVRVDVRQRGERVVLPDGIQVLHSLGERFHLLATAYDAAGVAIGDSARIIWRSLDQGVASVAPFGWVTGTSIGTARIIAELDGVSDTAAVEVRNDPATLALDPRDTTLASVNDVTTLRAVARNALGGVIAGVAPTWQSSSSSVASVAPGAAPMSAVVAQGRGTATITATYATLSVQTTVTVTNAPATLDILPVADTIRAVGGIVSPRVNVRNARGDTVPVSYLTWTSRNEGIATVNAGVISGRDTGRVVIVASSGTLRDSLIVVVRNDAMSLTLDATADTLTRAGQQVLYTATARNALGVPIPGVPVTWRSTNGSVATVTNGTVTSAAFGTTLIIAQTSSVADTVVLTVRNLTLLHVDNTTSGGTRVGTVSRPYVTIGAALADADAGDTIFVHVGIRPYAEQVSLSSQLTLLGDESAYRANGNDPLRLPVIAHNTGAAAILVSGPSAVVIRSIAVRHTIDGPAVDATGANVRIENVHVNPGGTSRIGRGILLRGTASGSSVLDSRVSAVTAYGIRVESVANVQVTRVVVDGVDITGGSGAGIQLLGGSGALVQYSVVRATAGARIQLDTTVASRVLNDTLAGRHQLVRLTGVSGATEVSDNVFTLDVQIGDPFSTGSASDGSSALEITRSAGVSVQRNVFWESGGHAMDAIRLIDTRAAAYGGATVNANRFVGGRYSVRSTRSSWMMRNSRSDNAMTTIVADDADSISLASDTLGNVAGKGCVDASGTRPVVVVSGGWYGACSAAAADTGAAAITVRGSGAGLTVVDTRFSGADATAIDFSGNALSVTNSTLSGAGVRTVSRFRRGAAISATATSADVLSSSITDYAGLTGVSIAAPTLRIQNDRIALNGTGVTVSGWLSASVTGNDIADNAALGLTNAQILSLPVSTDWWGDDRGPRRSASTDAVGDSIVGSVTFTPLATSPHYPGAVWDALRLVRGNNQVAQRSKTLPQNFTVRVVDMSGRPVAGVLVTFEVTSGGSNFAGASSVTTTSNASGLAEARLTLDKNPGVTSAIAYPQNNKQKAVTFTATGQ